MAQFCLLRYGLYLTGAGIYYSLAHWFSLIDGPESWSCSNKVFLEIKENVLESLINYLLCVLNFKYIY